jgi:two-component system, LuxR family, response regulator FixJ
MSSDEQRLVHIADDDDAIRRSVSFALKTSGFQVRTYETGIELLKSAPVIASGCILLDIRMPGMDGLEVQEGLKAKGVTLPVIIMTGHGDVSLAVRAMKAGAVDFIEKPFAKAVLLGAIEHAMSRLNHAAANRLHSDEAATKLKLLTARERDVLDGLAKGLPNKSIGYDLGISPRTVEIHRANLMSKLGVNSLSEALRIAFAAEEQ